MSFSKYRIAIPAAIFVCFLSACSATAQNRLIINQGNSGDSFLGISMEDVTASNMSEFKLSEERGVIVRSVQEESPAEEAGLRENDVIFDFAGQPVWSSRQFSRLVTETPIGRNVAITVIREGKQTNMSVTIGERTNREAGNRIIEGVPGGQIERFFEMFPGDRSRPPRTPGQDDRQNQQRSEQRPRLGVETQPLTEQMAEYLGVPKQKGVLITSVSSGSASDGKLKAGDVVIGINDSEVTNPSDLSRFVRDASGEVTIKVVRDKKQISIRVSLPSDETPTGGGYKL